MKRPSRLLANGKLTSAGNSSRASENLKHGWYRAGQFCIGLIRQLVWSGRLLSRRAEIGDYRRLERICRQVAEQSTMPELRTAMLIMAERYFAAADALEQGDRFSITKTF
jgi:hypothetical protein